MICIYPKRKQKFRGPCSNSGIYLNQEQLFPPCVATIKTLLVIMQVQKIYCICYCKDIDWLMTELGCEHNPVHWRSFIDSRKTSLKAVLLHNGNIKPSIPMGYSNLRKETYNTMKILLDLLEYPNYIWKICSDLKAVSFLLGLQLGYTNHMCFLCLWNRGKTAVSMQKKYGLVDKAPKSKTLWLALQMSIYCLFVSRFDEKFCESNGPG